MIDMTVLNGHLAKVGLSQFDDLLLDEDVNAKFWQSDYAELFVVNASSIQKEGLDGFLQKLDAAIAKRLRRARDDGNQREAHVCIVFDSGPIQRNDLKSEADISRYVSRKYWIDKNNLVDQILERLSLAWVDIQAQSLDATSHTPPELKDMRDRILMKKGAGAANQFLEELS